MGFSFTWIAWVILLVLPHAVRSQNCTANELQFQLLSSQDINPLDGDAGSIQPLYNMVQRFLGAVRPNSFQPGIIANVVTDPQYIQKEYGQVLKYLAGYLVCFIIAVLYFVLMPLVGLFFCCCRLCDNCGGHVKKRTKTTACERNTLATFLLLTTLIILAGVACAFTVNQKLTDRIDVYVAEVLAIATGLRTYFNGIGQNVDAINQQFSIPKNVVLNDLDSISGAFGNQLLQALQEPINTSLGLVSARAQDISNSKQHLLVVNATKASLQEREHKISAELNSLQFDITQTLSSTSCIGCDAKLINNLQLNGTYSPILDLSPVINKVLKLSQQNLSSAVEKEKRKLNDIPKDVESQMAAIVSDSKASVNNIEGNISSIKESFPLLDSLPAVIESLGSLDSDIPKYGGELKRYNYYRWIVSIVLCSIILLIIACNVLGLLLGTIGIALGDDPYSANGCSQSGANFLMAGVGFSFLFSWLLILLVFITFIVGGLAYTEICKPWANGDIYKLIDTIGSQDDRLNLSNVLKLNQSFSFTEVYSGCKRGDSLWTILQLDRTFDLDEKLNVNKYTDDLVKNLRRLNVDLNSITLLNSGGRNVLQEFVASGIKNIDYQAFSEQISNAMVNVNLSLVIQYLSTLSLTQTDTEVKSNLTAQIERLRNLETTLQEQRKDVVNLTESLDILKGIGSTLEASVNATLKSVDKAAKMLETIPKPLLKNATECFIAKELGYFEGYLKWVRKAITEDILSCNVVSVTLDNSQVIVCDFLINPWNAFWFCLAWCTLFLIPSIIFAVKTAKHFRPIKGMFSQDSSEMTTFKLPRAQINGP